LVTRGDAKIDYRRHARARERDNRFSRHLPPPAGSVLGRGVAWRLFGPCTYKLAIGESGLINVRFEALCRLKSDLVTCPRCADFVAEVAEEETAVGAELEA
jgi:hypothetical protein